MEIVNVKLKDIKPYENNPRFNDDAVDDVAKSIKEFGFKVPMVLDKDNVIVCGHTRFKAAQKLKLIEVPCIIAKDLKPKQIKAFRLADNKVSDFSIFDNKKLLEELKGLEDIYTGFDISEMFNEVLDESNKDALDNNVIGVQYEITFKSETEDKIKKIADMWDKLDKEGKNEK